MVALRCALLNLQERPLVSRSGHPKHARVLRLWVSREFVFVIFDVSVAMVFICQTHQVGQKGCNVCPRLAPMVLWVASTASQQSFQVLQLPGDDLFGKLSVVRHLIDLKVAGRASSRLWWLMQCLWNRWSRLTSCRCESQMRLDLVLTNRGINLKSHSM